MLGKLLIKMFLLVHCLIKNIYKMVMKYKNREILKYFFYNIGFNFNVILFVNEAIKLSLGI